MHHQMVASARAVKLGHELVPGVQIGCMMTKLCLHPFTCKPEDNLATQQRMRSIYRYVDIQVFGEYPNYLNNEIRNKGYVIQWKDSDETDLKEGIVDFVSFSYVYDQLYGCRNRRSGYGTRKYCEWCEKPISAIL